MMLVDTHCHLNFDRFDADRALVLAQARQAGVVRILNPGIDLDSSRAALALAQAEAEVYAAVGVHPNDCEDWSPEMLAELRRLAGQPKCVAIGEIGLDDYWDRTPRRLQEQVLQAQLDLAAALALPVVIHIRNRAGEQRTTQDALALLAEWQRGLVQAASPLAERPGVLHSYSDSPAYALQAVESQFYIGITGPVTFKKADELRRVAQEVPLDKLLIETDAPFLTPHPHRGERNQPAYVRFVAEKIAQVRGMEVETFSELVTQNAERLFHWQAIP